MKYTVYYTLPFKSVLKQLHSIEDRRRAVEEQQWIEYILGIPAYVVSSEE